MHRPVVLSALVSRGMILDLGDRRLPAHARRRDIGCVAITLVVRVMALTELLIRINWYIPEGAIVTLDSPHVIDFTATIVTIELRVAGGLHVSFEMITVD